MEKAKKKSSPWTLIEVAEPAEPLPGVAEVRAKWLGKWAWLQLSSEKQVWVKVYRVNNGGDVSVGVVREGKFVPLAAFRMEHVALLLKLSEK